MKNGPGRAKIKELWTIFFKRLDCLNPLEYLKLTRKLKDPHKKQKYFLQRWLSTRALLYWLDVHCEFIPGEAGHPSNAKLQGKRDTLIFCAQEREYAQGKPGKEKYEKRENHLLQKQ